MPLILDLKRQREVDLFEASLVYIVLHGEFQDSQGYV